MSRIRKFDPHVWHRFVEGHTPRRTLIL